jgi:hypothetical protein
MLFQDLPSVLSLLDRDRVGWVISCEDGSPPHVRQLDAAVESIYPAWKPWAGETACPTGLNLFRRTVPLAGSPKIEVDMSGKFGGAFRLHE